MDKIYFTLYPYLNNKHYRTYRTVVLIHKSRLDAEHDRYIPSQYPDIDISTWIDLNIITVFYMYNKSL